RFEIGRAEFEAEGAGDPLAIWRLHNPELQEGRSLQFALLFRTPPGAQQVQMGAIVFAEPDMRWLTGEIGHLFGELPERFRRLFTQRDEERTGAQRLPIGVHESWSLHLPRREEARPEAQSQTAAPAELEEQIVQALLDCAPADDPVAWAELVEEMNRFGWGGLPPAAESAEERVRGTVRAMSSWMTPSGFSMLSEFLFHVRSQTEGDCYARLSDLANSV
ncbi:MAG TPA: hypothetical protein VK879_08440, partial [Candidatus Sulfomarinibacteraceae bacterium]|nr:hypothetical protein [Candidatus Sulfomarinibacteraceae bacterium]